MKNNKMAWLSIFMMIIGTFILVLITLIGDEVFVKALMLVWLVFCLKITITADKVINSKYTVMEDTEVESGYMPAFPRHIEINRQYSRDDDDDDDDDDESLRRKPE